MKCLAVGAVRKAKSAPKKKKIAPIEIVFFFCFWCTESMRNLHFILLRRGNVSTQTHNVRHNKKYTYMQERRRMVNAYALHEAMEIRSECLCGMGAMEVFEIVLLKIRVMR